MPSLKYFDPATQTYKHVVGGMTQESVVALTGRRNVIRNGDCRIAQHGPGPWTATTGYTLDGWTVWYQVGTTTFSRVDQANGTGSPWYRAAVTGQATAAALSTIWLPIEDVNTLNGQVVTLSFDGMVAAGTRRVDICIEQAFGSGGSTTVDTPLLGPTLTTTKTRYAVTFTMPSTVGKTVGSGSVVWIAFVMSVGANNAGYAAPGLGTQNGTFSFTDVQLEAGNVATPFERLPIAEQLAWCQRYFVRFGVYNNNWPWAGSFTKFNANVLTTGARTALLWGSYPVPMRAVPSFASSGGNTLYVTSAAQAYYMSSLAASSEHSAQTYALTYTSSGPDWGVPNSVLLFQTNAGEIGWLDFSAEQ